MNQEQLESIFDEAFKGLTLFYRDTKLSKSLISKYFVGQILIERGYTDMSWKVGGLIKNLRYAIASSFGVDLSAINLEVAKFGFAILKRDSYFKVVDIYRIGDKTQILLLNIPPPSVDIFKTVQTTVEEQLTKDVRQGFDEKINAVLIEELQDPEWVDRTSFPIGMSDNGKMFL